VFISSTPAARVRSSLSFNRTLSLNGIDSSLPENEILLKDALNRADAPPSGLSDRNTVDMICIGESYCSPSLFKCINYCQNGFGRFI
jgi:hypothetical protein